MQWREKQCDSTKNTRRKKRRNNNGMKKKPLKPFSDIHSKFKVKDTLWCDIIVYYCLFGRKCMNEYQMIE